MVTRTVRSAGVTMGTVAADPVGRAAGDASAEATTGAAPAARESLQRALSLKLPSEYVGEANKALAALAGK